MRFCENCGQGNKDDATFCIQCGKPLPEASTAPPGYGTAPQPPPGQPPPAGPQVGVPVRPKDDGMAIASLVCSIASFVICPVITAIVGIILGYMSLSNIEESRGTLGGEQLAKAGIIIGWIHIGLVLLAGLTILILVLLGVAFTTSSAMMLCLL